MITLSNRFLADLRDFAELADACPTGNRYSWRTESVLSECGAGFQPAGSGGILPPKYGQMRARGVHFCRVDACRAGRISAYV